MPGPITDFMRRDHERLDALLEHAVARGLDVEAFRPFREGLLRHIAMEEKVLVPAAEKARGEPMPLARRLRLDHGAIAALLVPSPTPAIVAALRTILAGHNPLEEDPGGFYDLCDRWIGDGAAEVLERLRARPPVPLAPHVDSPLVAAATARALRRAGYDPAALGLE